jgi:phosphatidylglycerophosphatase C
VKKSIAFFDFDGTITTRDTLLEVIKYFKGRRSFYTGFFLHSPFLVAYKLNLIGNQPAKERILRFFFGGMTKLDFQQRCDEFAENKIPSLLRPGAVEEIARLRKAGTEIVIVSASAGNWIKKWAEVNGLGLIATRLEIMNDKLTGKIEGKNCYGEEKVRRIKEEYDLAGYEEIRCYGDSGGDRAMLTLATQSFYKPFREMRT